MMPELPVASIPQCKYNRHDGVCLESFHAVGHFEPSSIESHHASIMICNVRSLKSRRKTCSFWEEIITSSEEVLKDFESEMAVRISTLVDPTPKTGITDVTVKQTVTS